MFKNENFKDLMTSATQRIALLSTALQETNISVAN